MSIDLKLLPFGGGGVVFPSIKEGGGLGDFDVIVEIEVAQGGHPVAMRCLVLAHEEEGLVGVVLRLVFEPVDSHIGDDVGAVAEDLDFAIGGEEIGIVILALAGEDLPSVEALGIRLEVPFSEDCSIVAYFFEELGEGLLVAIELVPVVHEAIVMAVLTGEDDGSAGAADGVGAEAVFEKHSLRGELIDVGCRVDALEPALVCADGVRGVIV